MSYKFERDELLDLLIRAYNEGNCGFLDLSESVAEKLIEENESKFEESKFEEKQDFVYSSPPCPEGLQIAGFTGYIGAGTSFATITTGTGTSGEFPAFTVTGGDTFMARNFSNDQVTINAIHINTNKNDNLVNLDSNEENLRWKTYSETALIRKDV